MNISDFVQRLLLRQDRAAQLLWPVLLTCVYVITIVVYKSGGIKFVYSHSMYIPILIAGFIYGVWGGIAVAIIGGLALGPYMPIDTATNEMQQTSNWVYRTVFFAFAGILSGIVSDSIRARFAELNWTSRHDEKSRLPNRTALLECLKGSKTYQLTAGPYVLAVISFDNLAELKSAFGVEVIENFISEGARRFAHATAEPVTVFRSSSEQISGITRAAEADNIADVLDSLVTAFQEPFVIGQVSVHVDSRIGYVHFSVPDKARSSTDALLLEAEAASLVAHRSGQDCVPYSTKISASAKENLSILGELRGAMQRGELSLHYQPKVAVDTGLVCGLEALMRWQHPTRGSISPAVFIPRAEQSTLIQAIAEFSLVEAMKQSKVWQRNALFIPIAINISPRNLAYPNFAAKVFQLLDHYGLDGSAIEVEVTESALMIDMERTIGELNLLAARNIAVSVDDFGTGYSSLQYLHRFPVSSIKIDQSFVQRASTDNGALHIVESSVSLAHKMGIKAVAEGVETEEIRLLLARLGCDIAQGYAICRPLPADELSAWYAKNVI